MLNRRELLTLGGLLGVAPENGEGVAAGTAQLSDRGVQDLTKEIKGLGDLMKQQLTWDQVGAVRIRQYDFLRANGKFPDFIEVGVEVWLGIHDWHIRMQQPLALGRDTNGRYTMEFGFTMIVLRQDAVPTFVGVPTDQR